MMVQLLQTSALGIVLEPSPACDLQQFVAAGVLTVHLAPELQPVAFYVLAHLHASKV